MHGAAEVAVVLGTVLALALVQLPPPAAARTAALPSDFNGDGYADLAIGAPYEDVGSIDSAGAVNVLYGGPAGLAGAADQYWTQSSPGVRGTAEVGDVFGRALASGDFDADGHADLAIAATADRTSAGRGGAVNVLYGSRAGLTDARDQRWSRANISGVPFHPWGFGEALTTGDFDGDGYADLAIGIPDATIGGQQWAGAVVILRGGPDGLRVTGRVVVNARLIGAARLAEVEFGRALAAGRLDGDRYDDLAVGVPYGSDYAGAVVVLRGSGTGLTTTAPDTWSQRRLGFAADEDEAEFGASLAIGDFDADGFGDLAVGAPGECGLFPACDPDYYGPGAAYVVRGSSAGLVAAGSQVWHEDVEGVPGTVHMFASFGEAIATGDFDGDAFDDLAIGNPGERVDGSLGAGAVVVLRGGPEGLTSRAAQLWTQASPGIANIPERQDWLGRAVAGADYGRSGHDDLAISAPAEAIGARGNDGLVHVVYGSDAGLVGVGSQHWRQGAAGVKGVAENSDWFGWSLGR